ncbi:MAG: hypothetical protein PHS17_00460 [Desulfobacterales bacterium]|nr:hypothetical protein [Desulfobacterales bacterium]
MSIEQMVEISKALLTPVIAGVTAYIAWQQWKTNKQKLNLERYDRRLRVYEEVRKILSIIMRDAKASMDDLLRFRTAVSEADFLFGPEIPEYIDEIYTHGVKLGRWKDEYRDFTQQIPDGYDHKKVVSEMHRELNWLMEQFGPAKEKFKKYLDISK